MMFSQQPNSHRIFMRLAKALIRLRVCAGWSEALLVAHTTLLEISCRSSYGFDSCYAASPSGHLPLGVSHIFEKKNNNRVFVSNLMKFMKR